MIKTTHSFCDPFVQWFFPKLLRFVPKWMTANMISIIGIFVSILAGIMLAASGHFAKHIAPWIYALGGLLILVTWVTDTMDGLVARARNQTSLLGHYLDHFGDSLQVAFIGFGMFFSNGSHLQIGLMCSIVYLLFHVEGHIKVKMFNELKLPKFGPTEIRFVIVIAIIAQCFIDFSKPLSWEWLAPAISKNGWLTQMLHFRRGFTFIDFCGFVVMLGGILGLIISVIFTIKKLKEIGNSNND